LFKAAPKVVWPRAYPLYALLGLAVGLGCGLASAVHQLPQLQPLQKFYLPTYLFVNIVPVAGNIEMIEVLSPRGPKMAIDPWVEVEGKGKRATFSITHAGLEQGVHAPFRTTIRKADPAAVKQFLASQIYRGSFFGLFTLTYWIAGVLSVLGVAFGMRLDAQHEQKARQGVQLRGLKKLSPQEASRRIKGSGLALFLKPESK